MKLPSAVQKIDDEINAAMNQSGAEKAPGTADIQSIDQQNKPVSSDPVVSDPQETSKKVDPENWKERFTRYKASTDKTIAELRQLVANTQATVAEMQRMNQELMAKTSQNTDTQTSNTPIDDDETAYKAWLAKLPEHVRDEYEESFIRTQYEIAKATGSLNTSNPEFDQMKQEFNQIKEKQVKTDRQLYEEALDEAYPDDAWLNMAVGDEWNKFCMQQVSPVDSRSYGVIVEQGNNALDAKTVIWVLREYERYLQSNGNNKQNPDIEDPLDSMVTPENGAGAGADPIEDLGEKAESYTVSQVNQFFSDVTKGVYTPEEAKAIETKIVAAQKAGKIVQG